MVTVTFSSNFEQSRRKREEEGGERERGNSSLIENGKNPGPISQPYYLLR